MPGSSPRTWGTLSADGTMLEYNRFIPAHAGNSSSGSCSTSMRSVHPRARGEQVVHPAVADHDLGSSPRTRGTGPRRQELWIWMWFIPAHAGNRAGERIAEAFGRVHPRARGEQSPVCKKPMEKDGSSPRTRETGLRPAPLRRQRRFIPAHAGNRVGGRHVAGEYEVHPRARGEQLSRRIRRVRTIGSSPRTRGTDLVKR